MSVAPAPPGKRLPLPREVWLLSGVSFFADVSGEMVYPLLPLFLVGVLGASRMELGLIEGGAVLIVALMAAVAGFRSDRSGRRAPWIRVGYGLPVLGKALIAAATGWPAVAGGRLLDRVGKGLRGAPRDALIAGAVNADQRGRAFGVHRAADSAGAVVGVLLSALLLWWLTGTAVPADGASSGVGTTPAWVFRTIFAVGAVLGLASLALTFFVNDPPGASPGPAAPPVDRKPGPLSLPATYWSVLGVLVLFSFANSSDTFLLLRVSDLGYSPWIVVLAYAVYNLTYSALSYPAGALSDRFGRWRVIAVGWVLYAAAYLGFALLPGSMAWGVWPLMAVYGVYMALTDGVGKALIADHAPKERRGEALGVYQAVTGVSTLGASLVAGALWDRSGPMAPFLLGAMFAVLALLGLGVLRRKPKGQ